MMQCNRRYNTRELGRFGPREGGLVRVELGINKINIKKRGEEEKMG